MTQTASSAYTLMANLRWFALMFVLTTLAMSTVGNLVASFVFQFGLQFALVVPAIAVLAAFGVAALLAANRYADRMNDISQKRVSLALGYTAIAAGVMAAIPAVVVALGAASGWYDRPGAGHTVLGQILTAILTVAAITPLDFAIAWLVLRHVAQAREN